MKCRCLLIALIAFTAISVAISAEDVNGEWMAEIPGRNGKLAKAVYEFNVEGSKLTGAVMGYLEEERPLFDGKVDSDTISFTLREYRGERYTSYKFEGKISGDTIKFKVVSEGGKHWEFTARRAKP